MSKVVFYDDPHFDYRSYWLRRSFEHRTESSIIRHLLPGGQSLLDVGSGYGRLVSSYLEKYKTITLLDPSKKLLHQAKYKFGTTKIRYKVGVVEKIPLASSQFDMVLLVRVIHHLNDEMVQQAFGEINRVLVPGGYFLIEYANKIHLRARLRTFFEGGKQWTSNTDTIDRRTFKNIIGGSISFNNFHPKKIERWAKKAGFKKVTHISASYFRPMVFKTIIPLAILLKLEKLLENRISQYNLGPSNFLLLKKTNYSKKI